MVSTEMINILKTIEIMQKIILGILFLVASLGVISVIVNIIRLAIIRITVSMILVVSSMIINIVSKFLTFDIIIYHVDINNLILAITLLLIQILIAIIMSIFIFKKKKRL